MTYATYTTKALVCGTYKRNTADASFLLFTREAGMLYADARSVREERSKQRYALQDFSLVKVSLVKGKSGWKIGSIEAEKNYYHAAIDKAARGSVVNLMRLLRRFVKGEEASPSFFDFVVEGLEVLIVDCSERPFLLMSLQVHILERLGYVAKQAIPEEIKIAHPNELLGKYNENILKRIDDLYTHAVSSSHL